MAQTTDWVKLVVVSMAFLALKNWGYFGINTKCGADSIYMQGAVF